MHAGKVGRGGRVVVPGKHVAAELLDGGGGDDMRRLAIHAASGDPCWVLSNRCRLLSAQTPCA